MNFFEAQDQARRATRRLVVLYVVAVALIVAGLTAVFAVAMFTMTQGAYYSIGQMVASSPGPLIAAAVIATLFILGASAYKTSMLSDGGGRVAQDMGGTLVPADVQDPLRRRLRNVVEEMAIASGVPVPEIYVLEEESSINAFAAGYAPGDAAIAVTRGTLELLDRSELQGVIAHEFSHVLNGDMRLNIRLMGVLFGILVLSLMGRMIVRGGHYANVAGRRSKGGGAVLIIGLGLAVLGGIGVFFARMIKAGVSRQREYLADASAVQFTRFPDGIVNALKKIGGYKDSSYLTAADPEEVSHMLFGTGARMSGLFATHPPLAERIRAIDPSFKESDFPVVKRRSLDETMAEDKVSAFAPGAPGAPVSATATNLPERVVEAVGQPGPRHVAFAQHLRESLPASLYDAAHSVQLAFLLAVALVMDRSGKSTERQLAIVEEQLGKDRAAVVRRLHGELLQTRPEFRLALLEIAFPAIKLRPEAQLGYLVQLASRLIDVDNEVDIYEFCFYRVLRTNLGQAIDPDGRSGPRRASRQDLRQAAVDLLAVLADHGHEDPAGAARAFDAGKALFGKWAQDHTYSSKEHYSVPTLERSLDILTRLNNRGRETMLKAVTTVAAHDARVTVAEAELIRTACAALDVPLPPLLTEAPVNQP